MDEEESRFIYEKHGKNTTQHRFSSCFAKTRENTPVKFPNSLRESLKIVLKKNSPFFTIRKILFVFLINFMTKTTWIAKKLSFNFTRTLKGP